MKSERTVIFTTDELRALQAKAGPRDWTRFDGISQDQLEQLIVEDPDDDDGSATSWSSALPEMAALTGIEPELLGLLPPPGPARNAAVQRIVRDFLKRKAARSKRTG